MAAASDRFQPLRGVGIRPMTDADLPAVMDIENESYPFPWTEGIFRDCLRVGYVCRVAEAYGRIVGYTVMSYGAGEAHILNLCVEPPSRGAGVGRELLIHMLQYARQAGMDDAYLEVRVSNAIAARLYHSLGFQQVGTRRGYYQAEGGREDAQVLRLDLRGFLPG